MKKVSYGFSEALNLADDFRDALQDLQDDPTHTQIVVETDIKDSKPGLRESWSDGNVYFLIQKSRWVQEAGEYMETVYYTLSVCYTNADEKEIEQLLGYEEDAYMLTDLKAIVREIIDNHYITRIYPDSL